MIQTHTVHTDTEGYRQIQWDADEYDLIQTNTDRHRQRQTDTDEYMFRYSVGGDATP